MTDVNVIFLNPSNAITAIMYPRNILPESPINIFAGGKLCTKYPRVLPSIIKVNDTSNPFELLRRSPIIPTVKKYMLDIPDDKPSSPSIRFIQSRVL